MIRILMLIYDYYPVADKYVAPAVFSDLSGFSIR